MTHIIPSIYSIWHNPVLWLSATSRTVPIYAVFPKKFTPMTFMITMRNENQFK